MELRRLMVSLCLAAAVTTPAAAQRIRLPASLAELERRAASDSNDAAAHYNVALAYWNEKRWDDAEKSLRLAVSIDPRFAHGYLALSRLPYARRTALWEEVNTGRVRDEDRAAVDESDRLYKRAYLIDPLVDMKIEGAVTPARSVYWDLFDHELYDVLYQGFDDLRQGKYPDAYERIDRLVRLFDSERETPAFVWWYRAVSAAHVEKYDVARADLRRLLDRGERRERSDSLIQIPLRTNEYRYVLAYVTQKAGELNPAIDLYLEALGQDIGLYMAHVQLANMYEGARMWPQATKSRRDAIATNPDDATLQLDLGATLAKAGEWQEARQALAAAAEANPRDTRAFYFLGIVQQQIGQKAEARASFERFVATAPSRYKTQIDNAKQRLAELR